MNENPYQSPLGMPRRRPRFLVYWANPYVSLVAIGIPSIAAAIAMLGNLALVVPNATSWNSLLVLLTAAWTLAVLLLHYGGRSAIKE